MQVAVHTAPSAPELIERLTSLSASDSRHDHLTARQLEAIRALVLVDATTAAATQGRAA